LSPTLAPEDNEEYEDRRHNYEADLNARHRCRGEDVIWHTRLQRQEYNLNQCARAIDIHEAHLHRCEYRCDRREAEDHAARVSGTGRGSGCGCE
jgi:hypothetical protein